MGFPVACSELPSAVLHLLLLLGHLRRLIAAVLRLAGLDDLILDDLPFDSPSAAAAFISPPQPSAAIDRAHPAVLFSDIGVCGGGGDGCAVCLHDFVSSSEVRRLASCGHVFHRRCIDSWANLRRCSGATCPLCRASLLPSAAAGYNDDVIVAGDVVDDLFDDYSTLSFPPAAAAAAAGELVLN